MSLPFKSFDFHLGMCKYIHAFDPFNPNFSLLCPTFANELVEMNAIFTISSFH
jgi:hypothetical protein